VSGIVLIADSDADRAGRIAEACEAVGMRTRVVHHGADALETALTDQPDALVAEVGLPLIDGMRLSEILHANPRTHGTGILFIGSERLEAGAGPEGRVLPGEADPDVVARFLEALLNRRRESRGSEAEDDGGVEGQLSQIALTELLELFHVNRKTGVVELRRGSGHRAESGRVWLVGGEVSHAASGPVTGEKALYRMFSWARGEFVFRPGPVDQKKSIERPTRALLREGRRQVEEWDRLGVELPNRNARLALRASRSSLPNALHPLTQEVLLALELTDRVQDVLDRCSYPDYQVLRTLQTLVHRGMVEVLATQAHGEQVAALSPGLAARVRDWLEAGRPRGGAHDAKLLLFASEPGASRALASPMSRLPGAEAALATPGAVMAPAGRVALDEEVGIEFVEVSAAARHAPVWPLALHAALAVVFVHTGPPERSVEMLRPALEAMARRPRARMLHLLLQEKDAPVSAASLAERLGLLDDRPIVVLPLERPDEAAESIRELMRRAVG
jgi:CheY-like chemotaxis protein